jgi:deoxyribose-phosphate aldolase
MTHPSNDLARHLELNSFAADATRADIEKLCSEARAGNFFGVCVNGSNVELARTLVDESHLLVVALVGFPLGAGDADTKRYETEVAADRGAHEIDFVINVGRLKDGDRKYVLREMRDIVEAADERPVKAILEGHLLTSDEKVIACELALDSGVKFVVTGTDFDTPDVTVADVGFLREALGGELQVKAAGGIEDARVAQALINAGAARIGTRAGLALIRSQG